MIRRLEDADLPSFLKIWLDGNLQAHPFVPAAYWESHLGFMREALPDAEVYVYVAKGEILAFAGLTGDYIAGLFVRRKNQSGGIGHALMEHLKQVRGKLSLSVYKKNRRAVRFYLKECFRIVEERTDAATEEEEYLMEWNKINHII